MPKINPPLDLVSWFPLRSSITTASGWGPDLGQALNLLTARLMSVASNVGIPVAPVDDSASSAVPFGAIAVHTPTPKPSQVLPPAKQRMDPMPIAREETPSQPPRADEPLETPAERARGDIPPPAPRLDRGEHHQDDNPEPISQEQQPLLPSGKLVPEKPQEEPPSEHVEPRKIFEERQMMIWEELRREWRASNVKPMEPDWIVDQLWTKEGKMYFEVTWNNRVPAQTPCLSSPCFSLSLCCTSSSVAPNSAPSPAQPTPGVPVVQPSQEKQSEQGRFGPAAPQILPGDLPPLRGAPAAKGMPNELPVGLTPRQLRQLRDACWNAHNVHSTLPFRPAPPDL